MSKNKNRKNRRISAIERTENRIKALKASLGNNDKKDEIKVKIQRNEETLKNTKAKV